MGFSDSIKSTVVNTILAGQDVLDLEVKVLTGNIKSNEVAMYHQDSIVVQQFGIDGSQNDR